MIKAKQIIYVLRNVRFAGSFNKLLTFRDKSVAIFSRNCVYGLGI